MAYTETTSCRTGRFLPADPRYTWQIVKVRTWVLKGEELWAAHLPRVHNGWHHHVKVRDLHLILFLWAVRLLCGQLSTSVHLLISDSSFTAHAEGPEYWPESASLPISSSIWRSSLHGHLSEVISPQEHCTSLSASYLTALGLTSCWEQLNYRRRKGTQRHPIILM